MTYEYQKTNSGMGGLPTWMQANPFTYGAGPYAPGGPGGGMMIGPGKPGGPAMPQGRRRVCVQPPHGPEGVETGRGWPPEIGPQEESLMEAGCIATNQRCGGSVRAPAQYWDCPADMMFPGSAVPHGGGFYGLGNGEGSAGTPWGTIGAIAIGVLVLGGISALHFWGDVRREMDMSKQQDVISERTRRLVSY
jgi:hypothetical protein